MIMTFKERAADLSALLEFMQLHPHLATGKFVGSNGKETQRKLWKEISEILNSLGYGTKPVEKWQKVYYCFF
ncbi:hypothetical protein NQ314_005015 [Rhamnusium bicolor]|uniref:Regulatory protein zeste n=1 Tax=Rhamnusium bicolor TaxID=1586634 RepID=A0AAV8ZKT8_9CUCU|nr:hypothetical protein NQ314_005015 [Rhamnusium bicolor]